MSQRLLAVLALLAAAAPARADDDPGYFEHLLGATNINAATGSGALTAAFSSWGELTVLRWPSPSFYEHSDYAASVDKDARGQPYFGARPNQGSFAGVAVDGKFAWAHAGGKTALPDVGTTGPVAWLPWPAALHAAEDPRSAKAATQLEESYAPFTSRFRTCGKRR